MASSHADVGMRALKLTLVVARPHPLSSPVTRRSHGTIRSIRGDRQSGSVRKVRVWVERNSPRQAWTHSCPGRRPEGRLHQPGTSSGDRRSRELRCSRDGTGVSGCETASCPARFKADRHVSAMNALQYCAQRYSMVTYQEDAVAAIHVALKELEAFDLLLGKRQRPGEMISGSADGERQRGNIMRRWLTSPSYSDLVSPSSSMPT